LLLLTVTCAASALAFVDLRREPPRWEPGVRLVERLGDAVELPPAPERKVLARIGEIRFPRGARFVAVPFRPEPLRGFVVRVRVKTRQGRPPAINFKALTASDAERLGVEPLGLGAPVRGRSLGPCYFTELPREGWTVCQRYQGLNADEGAAAMEIDTAGFAGGEVREFEAVEAEQIPAWAPSQPQLAPLLRYVSNATPSGDSHRTSLRAFPGGRYVFEVVLPPRGELLLATGLDPGKRTAPIRFLARVDGKVLLDEVVRTPEWHEHALQLPDRPNRRARLELASEALPGETGEARGLWGDPRILARSDAPSILLVSIDAVRPDHLSAYGYSRDTSPALERVAQAGVRFERATAQGGRTWVSLLSFLSGRQPIRVGVREGSDRLPNSVPLLPDLLARRGYDTFAGSDLATTRPGQISRFDDEELFRRVEVPGQRGDLFTPVVRQMRRIAPRMAERPTFAWFHLEDAHYPLEPRAPLRYDPGYRGRFRETFTQDDHFNFHRPSALTPREMEHVRALYDSSLRDADDLVRELLLILDAAGATERTIVVITADHGEEIGDHDLTLEHTTPWDHVLHVPLFFLWPGHFPAGHVVPQRVQLVDLVPTLLSLAGLPPEPGLDGRDLGPLLRGGSLPEAPAYAELIPGLAVQYRGDEKLILNPRDQEERWKWHVVRYGKQRLYDVGRDPDEKDDLADREPARLADAKAALVEAMRRFSVAADGLRGAAAGQAAFEMMQQAGYLHPGDRPVVAHVEER
jgi:arylsulfatase A-like enzyme